MSKLIDSPFEICSVCDEYVFLDQSYEECAREHKCGHQHCPLRCFFAEKMVAQPAEVDAETDSAEER